MRLGGLGQALFHSFASRYVSIFIQLVRTTILARLLAPEEFGTFAIAFVVLATASIIKEFGINNFLIKEKQLSQETIQSAYGLLIILSVIASLVMLITARPIATFYEQTQLALCIQLLAISVLFSPFATITTALLNKQMNFKVNMYSSIFGMLISTIASITLAVYEFGVLALVLGNIIQTLVEVIILQLFKPQSLGLPRFREFGEILKYAKFVSANSLASHIGSYIGEILSGKYFSFEKVGLLNRANSTAMLFNQVFTSALNPVIFPHFSKINEDNKAIKERYLSFNSIILSASLPFYIFLAVNSDIIVLILFGEQWIESHTFLRIICFARILYSATQLFEPVLMGIGKADICMYVNVSLQTLKILLVIAFIPYGIETMLTASLMISTPIRTLVSFFVVKKFLNINLFEQVACFVKPTLNSLIFLAPFFYYHFSYEEFNLLSFIITSLVATSLYLAFFLKSSLGKRAIGLLSSSNN